MDIVIQRGATALAGVEVKASGTVVNSDFKGLRKLKDVAGKCFVGGVVLYNRDSILITTIANEREQSSFYEKR